MSTGASKSATTATRSNWCCTTTRGVPTTTARLVEKLITEDGVDFLLGPYTSGLTRSAIEVAEKHGTIMVEANGGAESLFAQGFQNLFAVLTPAGDYTQSALELLAAKGAKTVVIAHSDDCVRHQCRRRSAALGGGIWAGGTGRRSLPTGRGGRARHHRRIQGAESGRFRRRRSLQRHAALHQARPKN